MILDAYRTKLNGLRWSFGECRNLYANHQRITPVHLSVWLLVYSCKHLVDLFQRAIEVIYAVRFEGHAGEFRYGA